METMYDRIKRMDKHELAEFIYIVYQVGVKDGEQNLCDSPMGFFEYEKKLEQPLDLLVYENNHLKEEINKLHKKLGIKEKYKTNPYDYMFQDEAGFRDKE